MNKYGLFILLMIILALFSCQKTTSTQGTIDDNGIEVSYDFYTETQEFKGIGPIHGHSLVGSLKYKPDFTHLEYVNPDAPVGGTIKLSSRGVFDSLNPFIIKGNVPVGLGLLFDTLMESTADEPSSQYGLVAETMEIPEDNSRVAFNLRKNARFQDNTPVTVEDVVFSFNILREQGRPHYQYYYADVEKVEKTGDYQVTFYFKPGANPELPHILGQLYILSKAYYTAHTFNETTEEAPLGSGPYMVKEVNMGKHIIYQRNPDYWAWDLPIMKGRYNYENIHYIMYQDENVRFQGFKAGEYDFFVENISKRWATEYTGELFDNGTIVKELLTDSTPQGMQGYFFNTRKEIFKNRLVRKAISLVFDFEWTNKNLFYGAYTRTKSYFENSVFASYLEGLPNEKELALLEPFRDKLPGEVFTEVYEPPETDGSGSNRENIKEAIELLKQAGWEIKDTKLLNKETGEQFSFEIMLVTPSSERIAAPFAKNLEKCGIQTTYRTIDPAQYTKRAENFDFDMITYVYAQSFSPGNEQRDMWGSAAADRAGSRNYAGIKNEVVDALIEDIVSAKGFENLKAASRALDRVLLWNYYAIPQWHYRYFRIAYKNIFSKPEIRSPFTVSFLDTWWIDPEKVKRLQ